MLKILLAIICGPTVCWASDFDFDPPSCSVGTARPHVMQSAIQRTKTFSLASSSSDPQPTDNFTTDFKLRVKSLRDALVKCQKEAPVLAACLKAFLGDRNAIIDIDETTPEIVQSALDRFRIPQGKDDITTLLETFYASREFQAQTKERDGALDLVVYYRSIFCVPPCGGFRGLYVPFVEEGRRKKACISTSGKQVPH